MKVRFKKLIPTAQAPKFAHKGDAGADLFATSYQYDPEHDNYIYGTGLAVEVPEGHVMLIFPRSSNRKTDCYMTNHVGVVDSGYRGEVMITFKSRDSKSGDRNFITKPYEVGDRIAQAIIVPYPEIEYEEADELSETERGTGGHGSTGR